MKVLVLGASGLLGNTVFRVLSAQPEWRVVGTVRNPKVRDLFAGELGEQLVVCGDLETHAELVKIFERVEPDIVINCLSIARGELQEANLRRLVLALSVLPQRISGICARAGARLIHFSSDGVFSGTKGGYTEGDCPDATDAYGIAKFLGEVRDQHAISIRTSIIGHELQSANGLLEWFLAQEGECRCFSRAVFSGLPTVELARIMRDIVIPRADLSGVYHVAAEPISKCDLLRLIADVYGKKIQFVADGHVVIDRSLNADRFRAATGYVAPAWPDLIRSMHGDRVPRRLQDRT